MVNAEPVVTEKLRYSVETILFNKHFLENSDFHKPKREIKS